MKIKLYDHQIEGVDFLISKNHGLLADDMGLGKTLQAIKAATALKLKSIHIICPAVAKFNWEKEFQEYGDLSFKVAGEGEKFFNSPFVITSYEYASKYAAQYAKRKRDLLIVDEWHYLKNPEANRTKNIIGKGGLIHSSKRLWALTGTPAPNHAGELWTLLFVFGLTKLSYDGFISKYCQCYIENKGYGNKTVITGTNTKQSPELKKILKRCSLRRLKKDVLDLPPIRHCPYYIEGDDDGKIFKRHPELKEKLLIEQQKLLDQVGSDLLISDDKLLQSLQFLSQSISSLRRYHGLKKMNSTINLLRSELSAKAYDKIVVFGVHSDVLKYLQRGLHEFESVMIIGETPDKKRKEAVERFQNGSAQIFFGNVKAAGTALTLTAASNAIFIEQDWVPGNNAQAADRIYRIGQNLNVLIRYIIIKNSLDDKITSALIRKIKEIKTFL